MNTSSISANGHGTDWQYTMPVAELMEQQLATARVGDYTVALVYHNDQVHAIDNRCPHMGYPMDRGSVRNGLITCHWHHARFDLQSGGAFDLWADDVPTFPVDVRDGGIWVDVASTLDRVAHSEERLQMGMERSLSLVVGKAVILLEERNLIDRILATGLRFGCENRNEGWGQGLTILGCMASMLDGLPREQRALALSHGLAAVAGDSAGSARRFLVQSLPDITEDLDLLKVWFREFIEVRDTEGAERCVVSAVRSGADGFFLMDMLASAILDHRYIDTGHPMDFCNRAFHMLDMTGWAETELVLSSLVRLVAGAMRMEESHAWRHPDDLIEILNQAFKELPAACAEGKPAEPREAGASTLVETVLSGQPNEPALAVAACLDALRAGLSGEGLAVHICYAAAMRIARFHTSNEIGDWDTALHTFTFGMAVLQAFQRAPSPDILRGILDTAMSVHLDRFLNIPAQRIPTPVGGLEPDEPFGERLNDLLDQQYRVNQAGQMVADHSTDEARQNEVRAALKEALLREDRDFHTIQCVEAALTLHDQLRRNWSHCDWLDPVIPLVAAARYLAAHAPTMRAQGQTFGIALRLHRGEDLAVG